MKNPELKFDIKSLPSELKKLLTKYKRYQIFVYILMVSVLYGYLILQISAAAQREPIATPANESETIKRLRIDQSSIDKITQLEDQNVVVQSLFETARNNPFQE